VLLRISTSQGEVVPRLELNIVFDSRCSSIVLVLIVRTSRIAPKTRGGAASNELVIRRGCLQTRAQCNIR